MKLWCDEKNIPVLRILSAVHFVPVLHIDMVVIDQEFVDIVVISAPKHLLEIDLRVRLRSLIFVHFTVG